MSEAWALASRRSLWVPAGVGAAALAFTLGTELVWFFTRGDVPIHPLANTIVILTLAAMAAVTVAFAVLPGRDPLGLTERGRMGYVYAGEALVGLLFMHLRLTMPWLFVGPIAEYWPVIVMALAFVGVGLSELFRRRRQRVLAEPLERTGAFLPLLPVLGFWIAPTHVHFSILLLLVGLLYLVLAVLRRSPLFSFLAVAAATGGLWYLLHHIDHLALTQHPQLWFIPPALAALVAAHFNRDRLTQEQMTLLRYVCLLVIYVASTADIFIQGVAESWWLPLVLMLLSVAGVMLGILLQARSFLYLGSTFLLLSLVTMVWHASAAFDVIWIWYAAAIALGAAIMVLFAVFEKKRQQVLEVMGRVRQWEA